MNNKNLLIALFSIGAFSVLAGAPRENCLVPFSRSAHFAYGTPAEPREPVEPALPKLLTQVTQIGTTVANTLNVINQVGVTQVAQGSRAYTILQIASCNDNSAPEAGPLFWADSPTQMSIGDSELRYELGAVVGNWLLTAGTSAAWAIAAKQLGATKTQFPGGLVLPVLFLMTPTITSAANLLREGTVAQQLPGGLTMTAQIIGTGLVAVFLHPKNFDARWVESEWVDGHQPGYVKRYGMLFKDYHGGRHWFMAAEVLMSTAIGVLKSYLATEGNCRGVVTAAALVTTAYVASLATLRPNANPRELVFFGVIAGLQSLALTAQAISLWAGSESTQQKTRAVTESIIIGTEWALLVKSLYDVGRRFKSLFDYFRPKIDQHQQFDIPLLNFPDATSEDSILLGPPPRITISPLPEPPLPEPPVFMDSPVEVELAPVTVLSGDNPLEQMTKEAREALL